MSTAIAETDLSLLRRYTDLGDEAAFSEIVRRYAGVVFAASHRVLRDKGWAEDVSQETFFRLLKDPRRCSQSLGGWLHRAATRLALDTLRSESARRRRESTHEPPAVDEGSRWGEISPFVDDALAEMPAELRELLVQHFLRGVAQADLAEERGVSAATMSRRVRHAIDCLREELARRGVSMTPSVIILLCGKHVIESAPATLMGELGKMAMVSGKTATATTVPSWASTYAQPWRPILRAAAEWPKVSLCAAVGLGLYLATPYIAVLRVDRHAQPPPQESREIMDAQARQAAATSPAPEPEPQTSPSVQ